MFNVGVSQAGTVNVMTSNKGGLKNEQIADLAVDKIVSISDQAPPHIRQQANQFREHLKKVLFPSHDPISLLIYSAVSF